uniref:ShKT domain-containing protein n=1 Tax=Acrobeloides nanus TaxID=290746 RepID=A0A914DN87_9BILA
MLTSVLPQDHLIRAPPSIYRWIEENAHVCTLIPEEGKTLIDFMNEEEGKNCTACPKLEFREIPGVACAWEFEPTSTNARVGCQEIPHICIQELLIEFSDFYELDQEKNQQSIFPNDNSKEETLNGMLEKILQTEFTTMSPTTTSTSTITPTTTTTTSTQTPSTTTKPNLFVQSFTEEQEFGDFNKFFGPLISDVTEQTTSMNRLTPKFKEKPTTQVTEETKSTTPLSTEAISETTASNKFVDFENLLGTIVEEETETTPSTSRRLTPKFVEKIMEKATLVHRLTTTTMTPSTTKNLIETSTFRTMFTTKNPRLFSTKITTPFRAATISKLLPSHENRELNKLISKVDADSHNEHSIDNKFQENEPVEVVNTSKKEGPEFEETITQPSTTFTQTETKLEFSKLPEVEFVQQTKSTITMKKPNEFKAKFTKFRMEDRFVMGFSSTQTAKNFGTESTQSLNTTPWPKNTLEIKKLPLLAHNLNQNHVVEPQDSQKSKMEIHTPDNCMDTHELCCFWALNGECNQNPFYMKVHCAQTCGTCHCQIGKIDQCISKGIQCDISQAFLWQESNNVTSTFSSTTSQPTLPQSNYNHIDVPTRKQLPIRPIDLKIEPESKTSQDPRGNDIFKSIEEFENLYMKPEPLKTLSSEPLAQTTPKIRHLPVQYEENRKPLKTTTLTTTILPSLRSDQVTSKLHFDRNYASQKIYPSRRKSNQVPLLPPLKSYSGKTTKLKNDLNHSTWFLIPPFAKASNAYNVNMGAQQQRSPINVPQYDIHAYHPPQPAHTPLQGHYLLFEEQPSFPIFHVAHPECFNYHRLCKYWAGMGECDSNPFWMRPHCQEACKSCGETIETISVPKSMNGCVNKHKLCPYWRFIGECQNNPTYMLKHLPRDERYRAQRGEEEMNMNTPKCFFL